MAHQTIKSLRAEIESLEKLLKEAKTSAIDLEIKLDEKRLALVKLEKEILDFRKNFNGYSNSSQTK